jgi:hypothetical protein
MIQDKPLSLTVSQRFAIGQIQVPNGLAQHGIFTIDGLTGIESGVQK